MKLRTILGASVTAAALAVAGLGATLLSASPSSADAALCVPTRTLLAGTYKGVALNPATTHTVVFRADGTGSDQTQSLTPNEFTYTISNNTIHVNSFFDVEDISYPTQVCGAAGVNIRFLSGQRFGASPPSSGVYVLNRVP